MFNFVMAIISGHYTTAVLPVIIYKLSDFSPINYHLQCFYILGASAETTRGKYELTTIYLLTNILLFQLVNANAYIASK